MEIYLSADRRDAHAIAVAPDARDDARYQMTGLLMRRLAEAQRVHHRNGTRAHGEHVAHDAADTGRRALIGLDERGVVVALHLEDTRIAISDIDDARILAWPLDHDCALGRKLAQMHAGGFVGAMLAPHHREDAQFDEIGLAVQKPLDARIFVRRKPMLANDLWGDGRHRPPAVSRGPRPRSTPPPQAGEENGAP